VTGAPLALALAAVAVAVAGSLLTLAGATASVHTSLRVWPPGDRDWRYWFLWACWLPATAGLVLVGVLDAGTLGLPHSLRLVGAVAVVVGGLVAAAAVRALGATRTSGLAGPLRTDGVYRHSRHPQYVGGVVATVGWVLLTGSALAAVAGAAYAAAHLALPVAEEAWLRDRFGDDYRTYAARVPRFVGLLPALLSSDDV
jgi:protein-S-isoprenylcysteine O-methyltransferase Ste14